MRHILVCLDCSSLAKKVVPYALALARSFDCHITLLHVLEHLHVDPCKPVDPVAWEMQKHEAISQLEAIVASAKDYSVSFAIVEGKPAEQINDWVSKNKVDLIVLCSHGENGRSQWAISSTTQKLLASDCGSVFLLPASFLERKEAKEIEYARILVALDGSSWAESAIPFVLNIAKQSYSEITLAYVFPEPGLTHIGVVDSEAVELKNKVENYNKRKAIQYLEKTKSALQASTKAAIQFLMMVRQDVGHEVSELVKSEAINLVVMSTNSKGSHNEKFYGKVTFDVLVHSEVPVILLRGRSLQKENHESLFTDSYISMPRFPERATNRASFR